MPGRDVHVRYSVRLARVLGLDVPWEAHEVVQALVDYPRRLPRGWWRWAVEECPGPGGRLWAFLSSGLRARGVLAHDWRSRGGRELLYGLVECLYGEGARLLVDLHFALDMLWEEGRVEGVDPRVVEFLVGEGLV